jgi:hypothetical protein
LVLLLAGILNPPIYGQAGTTTPSGDTATFHLNGGKDHPPVKIVHLMLGQTEIPLDTPVPVDGMWMRKLSVVIQNVSPKTIVRAGINLTFPDVIAANKGPTYALIMVIGKFQRHQLMQRDGSIKQLCYPQPPEARVAPGALFTLEPSSDADMVQQETYKLASHITRVTMNFGDIVFDDESKWSTGFYYLAVPAPTVWQSITPEQFFDVSR